MKGVGTSAVLAVLCAIGLAQSPLGSARAADVEVGEQAGEAIASIADAVREFRLSSVPSELRIQADAMEFDFTKGELRYTGKVRVVQGEVTLAADELRIVFTPKKPEDLELVEATGNVRVERETETASGSRAVYDPSSATITLSGNAELGSGPNIVKGDKVVVYLDEGRATVEGGASGPVRAHIEPKSEEIEELLDDSEEGESE